MPSSTGRKPVLLIGLLGVTVSIVAFGLSKSFTALIVSRCLGGALNGNVAVIKGTMGEITDESNQARAFSFLPLAWSLGSVIGSVSSLSSVYIVTVINVALRSSPLLGGYLSHPADRFPRVFDHQFFVENPYVLPCLVGALFPLFGAIVGFFFLEETLKPPTSSSPLMKPDRKSAQRHGRFVEATSTTVPAPTEQRRLLEDGGVDTDSGYSTPARASRADLRGGDGSTEAGGRAQKPPSLKALLTSRVIAALTTYVGETSRLFLLTSRRLTLRSSVGRLSSRSRPWRWTLSLSCSVIRQPG